MENDRYITIVLCLRNSLPPEIIAIILYIIKTQEAIIIKKLTEMFKKWNYNFITFTSNLDFVRFYDFCVIFANKHNLTYTEFDNWLDCGLNIGWYNHNKNGNLYVFTSLKGGNNIDCTSVLTIFTLCNQGQGLYRLDDTDVNKYIPLGKLINSLTKNLFKDETIIYSIWCSIWFKTDNTLGKYDIPYFENLQQISKRELYRYQRLESNFKKLKMPQPVKQKRRKYR